MSSKLLKIARNAFRRVRIGHIAPAAGVICMAMAPSTSLADAGTIAVSPVLGADGLEKQFDLTFEVSATRYLCAAWAETDLGADYAAWTNHGFKVLGEVTPGTTGWQFPAPKGWGRDIRALRFFLVEKETAPYDSRVEWIESTGNEWINTGYIGAYTDVYDLHFTWTSGDFPMASFAGSAASENKRYSVLDLYGGRIGIALNSQYSSGYDATRDSRRTVVVGEDIYTRTIMKQGDETAHASSTGFDDMGKTTSIGATAAVANTTAPLYIFARNCGDTSTDITKTGRVDGNTVMRLYSCHVTHNGTPARNFIPCVKNGAAGLYDTVNGRFHGNVSGAGGFTAGPVVEEQLLGSAIAASSAVAPSRPVVLIATVSATASEVRFSATLAQSSGAVSATFAFGDTPSALGEEAVVASDWTQSGAVSFSAAGLSAGARKFGRLAISQGGETVRTYGFWFAVPGADGRTVAVGAEKSDGVIEAVISKAAGTTNVLFVAYGAAQGGDTPESWAHCERVCLVDGEARTIDVTVPGWGDTTAAMRFFLKEYVPYPFDAQVKWIASAGNEWINTGYVSRTNDVYTVSFRSEHAANHFIVGAYGSAGMDVGGGTRATIVQVTQYADNLGYGLFYGLGYNGNYMRLAKMELGADLTLQAEFAAGFQILKSGYMGGTVANIGNTAYAGDFNCDSPLYVFARNTGNTSTDIAATATKVDNKAVARLYSFSIVHNGTLVRDFVPVVKDGAGGLYDRVNRRCHWNVSGAGAIACGPAIPESGGEPGAVAALSGVHLVQEVSGTVVLKGAYAATADFSISLGSAGAAATANVVFEYGTTQSYGTGVTVDAAMAAGANRNFTVNGLSSGTAYFWRMTANGDEIASGTFTTQGAYRTVALREVVENADGATLCCRLDFGAAMQNETCRLVLAYGAAEGGVELSSWENCVVVGTVAPGDTSFEYNLPAGLVAGAFKYRFYLVADGDSLPGVTGVSFIESTGSEWIDTGYIGAFDDEYDISFRSMNTGKDWFLLGSYGPAVNGRYTVVQSAGYFTCWFNDSGNYSGFIPATAGIDYRIRASFTYGAQSVYVSKEGGDFALAARETVAANPLNTMAPLYLFCRNCANSSVDNVMKARLYSCRIAHNGKVVRDFVPCVKDGEAGLYDRVYGHFHGNISGNGAFIAGEGGGAPAAVYSYTVPTNGVGSTADYASKAGAITAISSLGQRVSATASVGALGFGDTYPCFEWWVEGGSVTNAVPFAAIPANDTAETHEYSTTFDAGDAWNRTIHCRFAVSNVYASATGGTCAWSDRSGVRSVMIVDDSTYTWQVVDGDGNGDWTDSAHWASDRPGNCIGVPSETSTVVFPAGSTSRVTMPDGLTIVRRFDMSASDLSLELFNASNAATLKPNDGFGVAADTTGTPKNQRFVFDGVSLKKLNQAGPWYICNASTFALRGGATFNSTVLDMINTENTGYTGRVEIGAGARWPEAGAISMLRLGGDGVMHVEGTLNVAEFKIGQFGNWGGGVLEIAGPAASVNVSKLLRCWDGPEYTTPSCVTFDIPADGWTAVPLRGGATADPLAGSAADSANVAAKLVLGVKASSAIIDARKGKTVPFRVPLISWPTGITAGRCELVAGDPKRIRLAWTYGGTDSEVDDGNPPTGLVAYVTGAPGTMIIVR